jgi:hypothetical protein
MSKIDTRERERKNLKFEREENETPVVYEHVHLEASDSALPFCHHFAVCVLSSCQRFCTPGTRATDWHEQPDLTDLVVELERVTGPSAVAVRLYDKERTASTVVFYCPVSGPGCNAMPMRC